VIAVRVLRDGVVVREAVFRALPVTLGRGPECDVVLFDASVSRLHARIEAEESGPVLRDLGSRNGLRVGSARVASAPVAGLLRCRVGLAEVEIEASSDAETREIAVVDWDHGQDKRRTLVDHMGYLALGTAGILAAEVADPQFWSPWNQTKTVQLLGASLSAVIGLPLASFVLMVALKAAGRRLRFGDTLSALCRATWLLVAGFAIAYASYYLLPPGVHELLGQLLSCAVFVAAGLIAVGVRRRRPVLLFRLAWSFALAAGYVGILATAHVAARRAGQPHSDYSVQPPLAGWTGPARDLASYEARLRATAEAAAAAADAVRRRQAD
jgi:hypothetical protein